MGEIEKRGEKRAARRDFQRALLCAIALPGMLDSENLPKDLPFTLRRLGMPPIRPNDAGPINRARNRLVQKGLLIRDTAGFLRLTPAGENALHKFEMLELLHRKSRRWDKRWRVFVFDIPERWRANRRKLRIMLSMAGFVRLQDSVWIFPYDCEDFIALLKSELNIGKHALYMIVDEI